MRVLVVEDDWLMSRSITSILKHSRFRYELASHGETAVEYARSYAFDAIVLDLNLPDLHGYDVIKRLREINIYTPVLVLSGEDTVEAKLNGFHAGADDYVSKPFQHDELVARLHALIRRSQGHADSIVRTGTMKVDLISRTVSVASRRVELTAKEYSVLELLTLRKGSTLLKELFLTHLYGGRDEPEQKIIDVYICTLRRKLAGAGDGAANCIETVWGSGYTLRDPSQVPASAALESAPAV